MCVNECMCIVEEEHGVIGKEFLSYLIENPTSFLN